jgi:hypothetical protein
LGNFDEIIPKWDLGTGPEEAYGTRRSGYTHPPIFDFLNVLIINA